MFANLEAELKRKKITREILARKMGMSISTISVKLNGKADFSLKQAFKIKSILEVNIPIEELFEHDKPA